MGWRYGGPTGAPEFYLASNGITTNLRLLGSGPFSTRVTSVSGGVITSIATTSDLTRDANRMTLECSDDIFTSSNTEIDSVTLNLGMEQCTRFATPPIARTHHVQLYSELQFRWFI